jgi:hypothetical protein
MLLSLKEKVKIKKKNWKPNHPIETNADKPSLWYNYAK